MAKITDLLLENFKKHLESEEKSQATIEKYIRDVKFFKIWLNGSELSKEAVLKYKKELCGKYAVSSVNSAISSINSFLEFLNLGDFKIKNQKVQRKIFAEKEKELTDEEYKRLLKTAKAKNNERLYLLIETICSSGIRVSELKFITKEAALKGRAVIDSKGKMRIILLPKKLCKTLLAYAKRKNIESGAIFTTRTGKPMDRSNIWKLMKALCEDANVAKEKVFPHNLRHLFARTYYSVERDIVRLADILGHSSVNTTRIYTMESGEFHRRQIERLNLLL